MSEEEIEIGEEEEGQSRSKAKWVVLVVVLLAVVGGVGGWLLLSPKTDNKAPARPERTSSSKGPSAAYGSFHAMEPFVVNLSDPGGKRYLKTRIELEFRGEGFQEELEARMPQLRDAVILVLSSKTIEEVQGVDGKIALRNELIMRINQVLKQKKIRNLYFTEFVVQ